MKVRDVFGENMDSPQEGDYFDIELTESELLGTYVESVMEDGSIILAADDKMLEMLEEMNMVEYTALPLDTMDDYTHRRKTLQDILRDPGMDAMTKKVAQQRLLQLDKEAKEKGFATEDVGEAKHFRTAYGWAGGSKPGGGTYKHPDQIKADREAKKAKDQEKNKLGSKQAVKEFAPGGDGGDGGDDGFSEETLKQLAAQWWNGDEDPRVEQTLMAAGWEIGHDEGYDDGGVFVVQSGDEHGKSYISWPAEELEGMAEGANMGASRDDETEFHRELDKLVHNTFGKRKDEGAGHEDMVRFVLDTERAYQAVMDRFGDHIMWDDNDYMLVPVKFWGDLQRVAHDADGIGAEDVDGGMHEVTGLSPDLLARYKKLAGLDASKADKAGDIERANKRFSGIVRATKKEFDNDAKGVKQTNEAQRTREQVKAELAKINDKIEAIVKDGGRVPMNDPLTVKLKALQAELKKLKESIDEAEYQGRDVPLGKPMQGDVKKFKVYVKNPKGNVVKVNFGDPNMRIKKSNPARRKSFRARHNCANPGPRHKARYWSCRKW